MNQSPHCRLARPRAIIRLKKRCRCLFRPEEQEVLVLPRRNNRLTVPYAAVASARVDLAPRLTASVPCEHRRYKGPVDGTAVLGTPTPAPPPPLLPPTQSRARSMPCAWAWRSTARASACARPLWMKQAP